MTFKGFTDKGLTSLLSLFWAIAVLALGGLLTFKPLSALAENAIVFPVPGIYQAEAEGKKIILITFGQNISFNNQDYYALRNENQVLQAGDTNWKAKILSFNQKSIKLEYLESDFQSDGYTLSFKLISSVKIEDSEKSSYRCKNAFCRAIRVNLINEQNKRYHIDLTRSEDRFLNVTRQKTPSN